MSNIYIALLRGINVGGKNKLAMRDLVRMFANNGCREVRTFIQSGNVIFRTEAEVVDLLPDRISQEITKTCRYQTSLILRSVSRGVATPPSSASAWRSRNTPITYRWSAK